MLTKPTMLLALPLALTALGHPATADARHRGGRVVVSRPFVYSYSPFFYNPFFFDPFYSPWYGWGGYPYGRGAFEASVRLDVEPREAHVYVDGYFAGTVDDFDGVFQRLHVTPGQHEIAVHLEGYRTLRERLYLGPSASRKISQHLERLPAGEPNEPPPSPPVTSAATESRGNPRDRQLGPGPRGRAPFPRRAPGPARSAPGSRSTSGTLSLRVQPGDAEVFIDGEPWTAAGDDVQLIVQLPEGTHRLEVSRDGYRPVTLEVEVRRAETTPVNVSLTKE